MTDLTTTIETGGGFINRDGQVRPIPPTSKRTLRANPALEYVSNSWQYQAINYLRALSFAVDDVDADFGDDLKDRMMLDSAINPAVNTLVDSILDGGFRLTNPFKQSQYSYQSDARTDSPDYLQSQEMLEFVQCNLNSMYIPQGRQSFEEGVRDMAVSAIACGNKVSEIVVEYVDGQQVITAFKPKPRRTVVFVVDAYNNVVAIMGQLPGTATSVIPNTTISNATYLPNLLPRAKFAVLTWKAHDHDPRGSSQIRAAYDPWMVKIQIKIERLKYLARYSGGALVGKTGQMAGDLPVKNPDGTPFLDEYGNAAYISPQQAMLNQLTEFESGGVIVIPFDADVTITYPPAQSPFEESLRTQDDEITHAILGTSRATREAKHGSKADSEGGQDVLGLPVSYGKTLVSRMIQRDVITPLIVMNYGKDALKYAPTVSLSDTESQDLGATITAFATAGYAIAPSQTTAIDAMLGLPAREADELPLTVHEQAAHDTQQMQSQAEIAAQNSSLDNAN